MKRVRDLRLGNYLNATCGLALVAAVGTAGYSMVDDEALRTLRTELEGSIGNTQMTLVYGCLGAWSAFLWLLVFVLLRRGGRTSLGVLLRGNKRNAMLAGVAICLAYMLVLISLAYVDNVSYVVGFRQLSIPLGATLGILILKETPYRPKVAGVLIMFLGLTLVALG